MSFKFVESVKALFLSNTISNIAISLGESESNIQKAINGAIPASMVGLLFKVGYGGGHGTSGVLDLAKQASNSSIPGNLKVLAGISGNESGGSVIGKMVGQLFGDKLSGVVKSISAFAGIKDSSAASVMNMTVPATLATLGDHVNATHMGTRELLSFLNSQKNSILGSVPTGLNLAGALGLGSLNTIGNKISRNSRKFDSSAVGSTDVITGPTIRGKLKLVGVLSVLVIALAVWLYGMNNNTQISRTGPGDKTLVAGSDSPKTVENITEALPAGKGNLDSLGNFVYDEGKIIRLMLPNNGGQLEVGEFSTEAKLFFFLNDTSEVIDTENGNWFELTNVRFKTGSYNITDESLLQLKNIVAISRAFPAAQFKLGGYTDNTGDSTKNILLSKKRAEVVVSLLWKLGAPGTSITGAEGYGPKWPIGDNAIGEGRAMNRRVAVNVKAK